MTADEVKDQFAWVITLGNTPDGLQYWGRTVEGVGRTLENLDAIRFQRKEDAESVMDYFHLNGEVQEHAWMG